MMKRLDPETGMQALAASLKQRLPLGAMCVLYARIGRLFQIPMRSFHPFVVGDLEANHRLLGATIIPIGLYLSLADSLAITATIWEIDTAPSTGIILAGCRWRRASFSLSRSSWLPSA